MGRRLHIPNPIATQYIAWKSLTGYQLRSIQPGLGAFPYASYTTMRSAAGVPRTTAKAVTEDDTAELPPLDTKPLRYPGKRVTVFLH